jgi:hypothetical protein
MIQHINIEGIPGGFCKIKNLNLGIRNNIQVNDNVCNIIFIKATKIKKKRGSFLKNLLIP